MLAAAALGGCSRDPEVLKQRFFNLGQEYLERGQYDEASILYRKALQQDALFTAAYCQLAEAEFARQAFSASATAFYRCFGLDPTNLRAFSVLADIYLATAGQAASPASTVQDLIALTERAEANNPEAFEIVLVKGLLLRLQGDLDGAVPLLRRAVELRPGDERAMLALAESLLNAGSEEEFERIALEAIRQAVGFGRMYDLLYVHYYRSGKQNEAEEIVRAKADASPDNAGYQLDLVGHYWRGGRRDTAEELLQQRLLVKRATFPNADEVVGDFYLQVGESQRAIEYYQAGRAETSDAELIRQLTRKIVVALAENRQWAEAAAVVEELLAQDPDDTEAISLRGTLRLQSGDRNQITGALQDLEQVVRQVPGNAVLRYRLGEAYLRNGDARNARLQFNEALAREPDYLLPKYGLLRLHLAANELTETTVLAEQILDRYPNDPTALLSRATAWIGLREYEPARLDLEDLIRRGVLVDEASFQLARLDVAGGRLDRAEQRLRSANSQDPTDDRALRGLAELYNATGRRDLAMEVLATRSEGAPERLDYRFDLALYAAQLQQREDAIREVRKILEQAPDHKQARALLGQMLLESGDVAAARTEFQRAAEGESPSPDALLQLGTLLAAEGKYREARPYFERALQFAPDNAAAHNNLAFILAESDTDLDAALTHAQRAKAAFPGNADFTDTLGLVYLRRGLNDEAVRVLAPIVAERPGRADYRTHYAEALLRTGDRKQARRELEAALESTPAPREANRIQQLLAEAGS